MTEPGLFVALSSRRIAEFIGQAKRHVCYAAPGIHNEPAQALVNLARNSPSVSIMVNLDFDEKTLRMGYGRLAAVQMLRDANIQAFHFAGFRSSILIVDDRGWVFTPTALYLESEPHSDETPNAIRLSQDQVQEILLRLSPAAHAQAIENASTPAEAKQIADIPVYSSTQPIETAHFEEVQQAIDRAPPVQFDVARQVRVFEPYLQYVELKMAGADIQRNRVQIPQSIQRLGSATDLEGRLRTTFDLIEKSGDMSSKSLEQELHDLRRDLTRSLGKDHGRVILKSAKPRFLERIRDLKEKLTKHKAKVSQELQEYLDNTRNQVVDYYLPIAVKTKPDALIGQSLFGGPTEDDVRFWLVQELKSVFPTAIELVGNMTLEVRFKDVTFETLDRPEFFGAVQDAYPGVDWQKAYDEFKAAGEAE